MNLFKRLIPTYLLDLRFKLRSKFHRSSFTGKSPKVVFTEIYHENYWGAESVSGQGSSKDLTRNSIKIINDIIKDFKVKYVLDLPCGDFNWMHHTDLNNVQYIGADIVKEIIDRNKMAYIKPNY